MNRIIYLLLISFLIFTSCQHIETGDTLDKKTIATIEELGLLDSSEKIIQYYSNHEKDKAGNFFTDKRIAHYWLDRDESKTDISSAYYQDIVSIDTTFQVYDFDIPYMTIKKKDSSTFNVYIDGTLEEKKKFFETAMNLWKKSNTAK